MALTVNEILVATITFDRVALEFALDLESSVQETLRQRARFPSVPESALYLDGFVSLRRDHGDASSHVLLPGQDAGPFQTLVPRFARVVQATPHSDLASYVNRGELAPTIRSGSKKAYSTHGSPEQVEALAQLASAVIAESYLGRLSYYRYGAEFLLEVERATEPAELYVEVVSPDELLPALGVMQDIFARALAERMQPQRGQ